jgi:hypothetical protein
MKEGLAALTKLVKVVMSYRPDRKNAAKPAHKQRVALSPKRGAKKPGRRSD